MLSEIRNSILFKGLSLFLGLYLLNISIDISDSPFNDFSEDLTYNEQESIVELIVEKVFGYENAIAEVNDDDSEDQNHGAENNLRIEYITSYANPKFDLQSVFKSGKKHFLNFDAYLTNGYNQITTPPPKI